jgi:hypothetical protein
MSSDNKKVISFTELEDTSPDKYGSDSSETKSLTEEFVEEEQVFDFDETLGAKMRLRNFKDQSNQQNLNKEEEEI